MVTEFFVSWLELATLDFERFLKEAMNWNWQKRQKR